MYNATVLDHFENPRNAGELANADGIGQVGNPACGDVMKVYLKIDDGRVVDIRCKTFGCAAAIACSSMASEMVYGRTLDEAGKLSRDDVARALHGLPERKMACSNLAPDAIRAAIADYHARRNEI